MLGHDVAPVAIHQHIARAILRDPNRQGLIELVELAPDFYSLPECLGFVLIGRAFQKMLSRDVNGSQGYLEIGGQIRPVGIGRGRLNRFRSRSHGGLGSSAGRATNT